MLRSLVNRGGALPASLVLAFALLASVACADPDTLSASQEAALKQRVTERWQVKAAKDFEALWEFNTPSFRGVFPKSLYVQKFSYMVDWQLTGVEVLNYDARAAVASVAARVMTEPTKQTSVASREIGAVPVNMREKWILIDGEWWHSTNY